MEEIDVRFSRPERWSKESEPHAFERFAQTVSGIRAMLEGESYAEAQVRSAALLVDTDELWEKGSLGRRDYEVRVGVGEIYRVISGLKLGRGGQLEELTEAMRSVTEPLAEERGGRSFWWTVVKNPDDSAREVEGAMAAVDARNAVTTFWPSDGKSEQLQQFLDGRNLIRHVELVRELSGTHPVSEVTQLFLLRQLNELRLTVADDALDLGMHPDAYEILIKVDLDDLHGNRQSWFMKLLDRMHEQSEKPD
ncbi:MAG TPA: hypothetical protein VIF43_00870 [Patescibacteria group bacterium]|jgi:hypothetical protein